MVLLTQILAVIFPTQIRLMAVVVISNGACTVKSSFEGNYQILLLVLQPWRKKKEMLRKEKETNRFGLNEIIGLLAGG